MSENGTKQWMVTSLGEIPPGEGRNFKVGGEEIAIFHTRDGNVFATQARCPHRNGPLADGLIGGETLICPLHSWKFDLRSGKPLLGECEIKTYRARVDENHRIVVEM